MNNFFSRLTLFLYIIFFLLTGIAFYFIYKDFTTTFPFYFIIGYIIFLFCFIFYLLWMAVFTWKKNFSWSLLAKKVSQCICFFLLFSLVNYLFSYFFHPNQKTFAFSFTSLGLAIGLTFLDIPYFQSKSKK
jgi:hypothetical protein